MTTPQQASPHAAYRAGSPVAARFVWHDLMTTDLPRARAFYTALFGWELRDMDMGPDIGAYPMIHAGERGIGGMVQRPGEEHRSVWLPYIAVADVDAACARVPALGGTVELEPTDIPGVGRFAVVADPRGAMFCPIALVEDDARPEAPPAGTIEWNELLTTDVAGACAFYGTLLGWTSAEQDMVGGGTYTVFAVAPNDVVAGAMRMPDDAASPPTWLPYVVVDDVDASARRARELGARVFVAPTDIPGVGRFSVLGDPTGATVALYRRE